MSQLYRPFIDDPAHITLLDGQRYVVLRAVGALRDAYAHVQGVVREKLSGLAVSYPAQPHVTLAGLARGTAVRAIQAVVTEWAPSVPPLHLDLEQVSVFPAPFQIVIVQLRKTPALALAMSSLRQRVQQHGLSDLAKIDPTDWVFHLSVAYCSGLDATSWDEVTSWVDALVAPTAQCIVSQAEIVAFDGGQESSAGIVTLTGSPVSVNG